VPDRPSRDPGIRRTPSTLDAGLDPRSRALEQAADLAMQAPSVHNTQPWMIELRPDRLVLRADRSRQLTALDPLGRELVISVGAALLNARVALAARGWAAVAERLPDPDDADLLAVLRPVEGVPEPGLAELATAVGRRRTNRRRFTADELPDRLLRRLTSLAQDEGAILVPVVSDEHRRLVARLTAQADRWQNADAGYRAELRRWTTRSYAHGDGVPAEAVPHVTGREQRDLPLRDFDSRGTGGLPPRNLPEADRTLVLLATAGDDTLSWLRSGEALERLLLELTRQDWVASPLTQAVEVPLTRTQLRSALTWDAHPQILLRIGHAEPTPRAPRRRRSEVVANSQRQPPPVPAADQEARSPVAPRPEHRPVSDGRGGTTWI
jgi:nitroreductase